MRFENGTRHELFRDISVKERRKKRRHEGRKEQKQE
jgi:hypothetical protein